MLIYAHLFKFTKNASSPSFLDRFRFWLFYLVELSWLHKTSTQNFEILYNSLIIIIYVNLFIFHKKCFFSLISRPIFILIVLSHRARCRVQNLYTEFWNSLIMFIYAHLFKFTKNASSPSFLDRFWFWLFYLIRLGAGFKTSTQNFEIHSLC